ncbi:hypothetical protein WH50_14405 [Pokkaliibacter plantistimulans]|uniref:Transposase DDE domain-containing protein n=1 Tax=Pokkaliibacter plantistimulans TaxID=1635171 RepID=A0ABX5LVG0_9GAMM|nr:hypothetical protein WH50_14405 [Pokkaliibacter plantistimulans]
MRPQCYADTTGPKGQPSAFQSVFTTIADRAEQGFFYLAASALRIVNRLKNVFTVSRARAKQGEKH